MVYDVLHTETFDAWRGSLRDNRAKVAILRRLNRLAAGNFGDHKSLGGGINELRIDVSAGYRVYFTQSGKTVIILLAGGDKSSRSADIRRARQLVKDLRHE